MGLTTVDEISILFDINVTKLYSLEIKASVNSHGFLQYTGQITQSDAERHQQNKYECKSVKVIANDNTLFCGFPLTVQVTEVNQVFTLYVKSVSYTYMLTYKKYNHFYQDTTQTYKDMIKKALDKENASLIATQGNIPISQPILQYEKTPWSFSLRIAGKLTTVITPNITLTSPQLCLGLPKGENCKIEPVTIQRKRHVYMNTKNLKKYNNIINEGFNTFEFCDGEFYQLGDEIIYNVHSLKVVQLEYKLQNGVMKNTYAIGTDKDYSYEKDTNVKQIGLSLQGQIIAVRGEEVKVCLGIPDDAQYGEKKAYWFEFASEINNGVYSIPPIGTGVALEWQDENDGAIKAIHSVRGATELAEHTYKSFTTEYEKHLNMTPQRLAFTSDFNVITLKKGIRFNTMKKITLHAQKDIALISGKKIKIKTPEKIWAAKSDIESSIVLAAREIDIKSSNSSIASCSPNPSNEAPARSAIKKIVLNASTVSILDASTPKF